MVKLVFLCRRRPEIDHASYVGMVLEDHVPLALRHHPTMRGYVVNVVDESPAGGPELDSVAALSFATLEDFRERLYDSEAGRRVIGQDVARFLGHAAAYVTREAAGRPPAGQVPLGARSPFPKLVCLLRRRTGLTRDAFREHWLARHVPDLIGRLPALVAYVANVVEEPLDGGDPLDGIAELYFAPGARPPAHYPVREGFAPFADPPRTYRVVEYVQKRPV